MKRNLVLSVLCFIVINYSFSQDISKAQAIDLIVADVCKELGENKELFSKSKTLQSRKVQVGLILMKSVSKRKKESKEFAAYLDDVGVKTVGEDVGMKLAFECGDYLMEAFSTEEIVDLAEDDEIEKEDETKKEEMLPPPPLPKDESDLNMTVLLKKIETDPVSFVLAKDISGKTITFLIVNQFLGKEHLVKKNTGKQFKIYYENKKFYDINDGYSNKKVVKFVEFVE
ncbi:hypothetical protein [Seonamhaeicola marinus]|uniref:Uncharacterized protein n=1 Tax=Seonamhaeicola marinus TaxID=1912246 RepID=A0A5D0IA62_9FLAO|nr:hypothetical protein [Seonamhaeicola marinus]TYA78652.1 hypothetical protein FUA24_09885 [Seonamhaeicola marinus]